MSDLPPQNNPYAAPVATMSATPAASQAENIRNQYLSHEASVKSVGLLYMLGGGITMLLGVGYLFGGISLLTGGQEEFAQIGPILAGVGAFCMLLGGLQIYSAISLRKLGAPGRIIATIFSGIGLLGFPIGTLISGYILYLLWSAKGNFVFAPEYKNVIAQTPHIKYKTSIVVWILLGLLVLLFAGAIMAAFVGIEA